MSEPVYLEFDNFESLIEFKWSIHWGGEVEFQYKDIDYSVTYIPNTDWIAICKAYQPETEYISTDIEKILDYCMDDGKNSGMWYKR